MQNLKKQETTLITSTKNCTYDVVNFPYVPNSSMAGIFFLDHECNPCFNPIRPDPSLNLPKPHFFSIPTPFTICSSIKGLILCRDSITHTYHVCNPFVHDYASYEHIAAPPRSHQMCPPAVLTLDLRNVQEPSFHIICAVEYLTKHKSIQYTFDIYNSHEEKWLTRVPFMHLGKKVTFIKLDRHIIPNTGISNTRGDTFWLMDVPIVVVKFTIDKYGIDCVKIIDLPRSLWPWVNVQIGRMGDTGIGLVASSPHDVRFFFLRDSASDSSSWEELCCLTVGEGVNSRPELLRFEKEVPLLVHRRIMIWEIVFNASNVGVTARLHRMPAWRKMPWDIGDSVPYVQSLLVPAEFDIIDKENSEVNVNLEKVAEEVKHQDKDPNEEEKEALHANDEKKRKFFLLTKNCPYDVLNFRYYPGSSMAGIFFFDAQANPSFNLMRPYPYIDDIHEPNLAMIPEPFAICSSTKGLILCHDFQSSFYHVCNPFVYTESSCTLIEETPRPHEMGTPAVLVTDYRVPSEARFNIICAIEESIYGRGPGFYTFDVYSSYTNEWYKGTVPKLIGRSITPNSGISNSTGSAFWLTEPPYLVVKYNMGINERNWVDVIDGPQCSGGSVSAQIGRILDSGIGLVVLATDDVNIFFLRDKDTEPSSWELVRSFNVKPRPELLRFETEVALWVDGRVFLFELRLEGGSNGEHLFDLRRHEMPAWVKIPSFIGESVPYVHTLYTPAEFSFVSDDEMEE